MKYIDHENKFIRKETAMLLKVLLPPNYNQNIHNNSYNITTLQGTPSIFFCQIVSNFLVLLKVFNFIEYILNFIPLQFLYRSFIFKMLYYFLLILFLLLITYMRNTSLLTIYIFF